jgi:glycerophosphoryl diester phosphodiesterase
MNLFKHHIRNKARKDFIICGHRGDPRVYPENTIPALSSAVSDGANAVEVDLCITSDGVVILWHDWDPETVEARFRYNGLEPDTGFTPYMEMRSKYNFNCVNTITHKEVLENYAYRIKGEGTLIPGGIIPNLGAFLNFVKQNEDKLKYIFLDIKCPEESHEAGYDILEQVQDMIKDLKPIFVVESFSRVFLIGADVRFKESFIYGLDSAVPPGFIFNATNYSTIRHSFVKSNSSSIVVPLRPTALTWKGWLTYKRIINHDIKQIKKHNMNLEIVSATINDEDEMRYLIKAGITGIQTNYPKKLADIVKELT